jgi:hypothetical protein
VRVGLPPSARERIVSGMSASDTTAHVGLSKQEAAALDAEIERIRAREPGANPTRGSVIRSLIRTLLPAVATMPAKRAPKRTARSLNPNPSNPHKGAKRGGST